MKKPTTKTLVNFLLKHALKIMPKNRSEWGLAMKIETNNLSNGFQALLWALGCLKTATIERIKTMKTGSLRVSRLVLSLEVLCCFIPVCLVFNNLIHGVLTVSIRDLEFLIFVYTATAFSLIGPVGLILGLKILLRGPFKMGKILKSLLSILAMGIFIVPFGYKHYTYGNVLLVDMWLVIILVALMPAMAIFHMIYLSQEKNNVVQQ